MQENKYISLLSPSFSKNDENKINDVPEPAYFAKSNAAFGMWTCGERRATIGKRVVPKEEKPMMKMAPIRRPILPVKSTGAHSLKSEKGETERTR